MVERSTNSFIYKIAFGGPFVVAPKEHPPVSLWGFYLRFLFKLLFVFPVLWILVGGIMGISYAFLFMVAKCPDLDAKGPDKLARDIRGWPTIFGRRIYPIVVFLLGIAIWVIIRNPILMPILGALLLGLAVGVLLFRFIKRVRHKIFPTVTFVNAEKPKYEGLDNC